MKNVDYLFFEVALSVAILRLKQALNAARCGSHRVYCKYNGAIVASLDQVVIHRLR